MADLEFTQDDIEGLTQKLATLWPTFNQQERELLRAIFAAAADRAQPPGLNSPATLPAGASSNQELAAGADYQATLAYYQRQLLTAYIPGNSFDSITAYYDTGRIVGPPPGPPFTPPPRPPRRQPEPRPKPGGEGD